MTGHICPECGTDSRPGARPDGRSGTGCACGRQAAQRAAEQYLAAEQHRTERSAADRAETAAAEDFDPLRIRPYVTLGNDTAPADVDERPEERGPHRLPEDAATTMPLFLGPATAGPLPDATDPAVPAGPASPASPAGPADPFDPLGAPGTTALAPPVEPGEEPGGPRRRRPFAAVAVGAALVAAVGTAAFASGLLGGGDNGDADRRQALPGTTVDVPEASTPATESASTPASPSPSASASVLPSAPASASPSASTSPSSSASASSQPPSPTPSRTASTPPSTAPPPAPLAGPTLRRGDQGPAVAELQRRLAEVWLYHGRDDGDYSNQVEHAVSVYQSYKAIEGDPPGVYGPGTRRALEAETTGRGPS